MSVATVQRENSEQMILSHLPQVELLARQAYMRCRERVALEDLVSVGTIGLIQAVDRYDASSGYKLKTLAEHRIRGSILDYLRNIDPLPRPFRKFQKNREKAIARLEAQLGRTPLRSEVAAEVELDPTEYDRLSGLTDSVQVMSLDATPALEIAGSPGPERAEVAIELHRLATAISALPKCERAVISGLLTGKTPTELAAELHVCPTRVSQLKQRGIVRLRLTVRPDYRARDTMQRC